MEVEHVEEVAKNEWWSRSVKKKKKKKQKEHS